MAFALKLKALREQAGISQYELAARAGLSRQALSHLEQGNRQPAWNTVKALAKALGVSVSAFDDVPKEEEETAGPAPEPKKKPKKRKKTDE